MKLILSPIIFFLFLSCTPYASNDTSDFELNQNLYENNKLKDFELFENTKEYIDAKTNFDILSQKNILKNILNTNTKSIAEPEWGFPKGRKKQNETDIECSLREFTEETQYKSDTITINDYNFPYHEIFFGTNKIMYKHTYYIAQFIGDHTIPKFNKQCMQQIREIRAIKWMKYNEVLEHINLHNIERIELFKNIHNNISKQY